jgi:hypothetical protein
MNKKLKTSIKIAAAVFASAVVICFATPHTVHTDGGTAHGVDFPVKAAVVTTLETSTTVTTGTTSTSTSTSTTSTTTSTSTTLSSTTTTVVTEEVSTTVADAETTVAAPETAEPEREFVVFKPNTHYIHRSTCHWAKQGEVIEIENTENIECRICSECKPDLKVINEYVEPISNVTPSVSEYDYTLLCKIVASEYGGMADTYERAKIVASVMNMVNDSRWPGTVEGVLDQTCAPWGFNKYAEYYCGGSVHYSAMSDAVDYYFNNPQAFAGWTCNQWSGDGQRNYFRTI